MLRESAGIKNRKSEMNIHKLMKELKIGDKICNPEYTEAEFLEFPGSGEGWIPPNGKKTSGIGYLPDEGWEYYQPKNLNFVAASKVLFNGGKVRRDYWGDIEYIEICGDDYVDEKGGKYDLLWGDFKAKDWEVYKEKTYSFIEIIKIAEFGTKFRRKNWLKLATATIKDTGVFNLEYLYSITKEDFLAEDWVIVSK